MLSLHELTVWYKPTTVNIIPKGAEYCLLRTENGLSAGWYQTWEPTSNEHPIVTLPTGERILRLLLISADEEQEDIDFLLPLTDWLKELLEVLREVGLDQGVDTSLPLVGVRMVGKQSF